MTGTCESGEVSVAGGSPVLSGRKPAFLTAREAGHPGGPRAVGGRRAAKAGTPAERPGAGGRAGPQAPPDRAKRGRSPGRRPPRQQPGAAEFDGSRSLWMWGGKSAGSS